VNAVVGFDLHRGAIAIADRPTLRPLADVLDGARRVVVLEGINDAENLGAIARSARGLGADGLVLDPTCADPYYRRSVRVSMGEMLHLPIARAPLSEVFDALDDGGFHTWALTPRRDATLIGTVPGQPPYDLDPLQNNTFKVRVLDGYKLRFKVGDDGEVSGLLMIQPGAVFDATREKD
jgi:tRNA G18 (ribose-2'-O)-methylase SpoU